MFGHRPSALVGRLITNLLPTAGDVDTDQHKLLGLAAAAEGRKADGSQFPVAVSISKVRIEGEPLYLAIVHDLTPLADARRQAEESSRAKTAFLRHMSHELRTPLNGIIGMAALLRQTRLDADQQKLLASLAQSGEALLAVVDHLLDFSRLEAGEVRLERRPFTVRETVAEAAAPMAALARAKGIRLTCNVADDVPGQLVGDPGRLRTVLGCLVANAVKFTPSGEVSLRVVLELDEDDGLYHLGFSVRDTGDGIGLAERDRIFLPFEQGPGQVGGVGLGLAIATRLAALMNGKITVDSTPGQGSTFLLRLPFETAQGGKGPLPVLVVMADAAERAALQEVLHGLGLKPAGVPTGKAALAELMRAQVQGEPYGMVVVEETLADADAGEWVRQLQTRAGWAGTVVMLKEGEGPSPEGVTAVLDRRAPSSRLGGMVARHAAAAV
jgi:signal transduction histidine kinase